jgi:hypothetical protein
MDSGGGSGCFLRANSAVASRSSNAVSMVEAEFRMRLAPSIPVEPRTLGKLKLVNIGGGLVKAILANGKTVVARHPNSNPSTSNR